MTKKLVTLILLAITLGCSSTKTTGPKFRNVVPVGELGQQIIATISVMNVDRNIHMSGGLLIEFRLMNIRPNEDALIYNELQPGWLVMIEILGEDGNYQFSPTPDNIKRNRDDKRHYVLLPPGGFVGRIYSILPKDPMWNLPPGKYKVRIVYCNKHDSCVASPNFTSADLKRLGAKIIVRLLTGLIASNIEEFNVVDD